MKQNIQENIQKNLVELRKANKLKQSDLAEKIGYSDKTISRWENGSTIPDIVCLSELADFYGITVDQILKENAVTEASLEKQKIEKEESINRLVMFILSIITIWAIAIVVYVVYQIVKGQVFWQVYVWAVPVSGIFIYRFNVRNYRIRWVNTIALSLVTWSIVTAVYLMFLSYSLWQLFLIPIPIEAMIIVYTLFSVNGGAGIIRRHRK